MSKTHGETAEAICPEEHASFSTRYHHSPRLWVSFVSLRTGVYQRGLGRRNTNDSIVVAGPIALISRQVKGKSYPSIQLGSYVYIESVQWEQRP